MVLFFPIVLFFPMLPLWLPPGHSAQSPPRSGNFSAQTSASFHSSRSAAPAPLSLCCTGSLTMRCSGAPDSVLHWVFDSALHRVFDSALHWCPCRATPHGRLKLCAVPAPRAGNKPHLAAKSTPVWLAIWHIWAGFANSQHRDAAFATPNNICAHSSLLQTLSSCSDRRKSLGPSAPIAYATSVSPPNEAVAWQGAAFLQITAHASKI